MMETVKYIVIFGDVKRGFSFHGVFDYESEAIEWADRVKLPYTVSYITIHPPR